MNCFLSLAQARAAFQPIRWHGVTPSIPKLPQNKELSVALLALSALSSCPIGSHAESTVTAILRCKLEKDYGDGRSGVRSAP